jgi:hypothetical protein
MAIDGNHADVGVNEYKALENAAGVKEAKTRDATSHLLEAQKTRDATTFVLQTWNQLQLNKLWFDLEVSGWPDVDKVRLEFKNNGVLKLQYDKFVTALSDPTLIEWDFQKMFTAGIDNLYKYYQQSWMLKVWVNNSAWWKIDESWLKRIVWEAILLSDGVKDVSTNYLILPFFKHAVIHQWILEKLEKAKTPAQKNALVSNKTFRSQLQEWIISNPMQWFSDNESVIKKAYKNMWIAYKDFSYLLVNGPTKEILTRNFLAECVYMDAPGDDKPQYFKKPIKVKDKYLPAEEDDTKLWWLNWFVDRLFKEKFRKWEKLFAVRGAMLKEQDWSYPQITKFNSQDYKFFNAQNDPINVDNSSSSSFNTRLGQVKK